MNKTLVVYLDRNIFDALNKMPNGFDYVVMLQKFIKEQRILIPSSVLVLQETLPVLKAKDKTKVSKEEKLLSKLVDWTLIIKAPQELIVDALNSWATKTPLPVQYYQFFAKSKDFFQAGPEETANLIKVIETGQADNDKHLSDAKGWQRDAAATWPAGTKATFQDMWDSQALPFLDSLIERLQPSMMGRTDKEDLFDYKVIELWVCYALAYGLKNVIEGQTVLRSDMVDFYHIVSASVADVFVTNDTRLYDKMSLFGIDGLDVMKLDRFLRWIKGGCR